MCETEPAAGTTPLHNPATPAPALLISRPQPRAMRAGVTPQGTTLDPHRLCLLVARLLGEVGCPRHPLDPEISSMLKVNDRYSGDFFDNEITCLLLIVSLNFLIVLL